MGLWIDSYTQSLAFSCWFWCSANMVNFNHSPKSQLWNIRLHILQAQNIPRDNNPTKFAWDPISGIEPHGGEIYGSRWWNICITWFIIFRLQPNVQPKPVKRFPRTIAQKTRVNANNAKKWTLNECSWTCWFFCGDFRRKPHISRRL